MGGDGDRRVWKRREGAVGKEGVVGKDKIGRDRKSWGVRMIE